MNHAPETATDGTAIRTLLAQRRSVRKYETEAPSKEVLRDLIKVATWAPSSGNEQPWRFIVVRDVSLLKRLSDDAKRNLLEEFASNSANSARKYASMLGNPKFNIFYNAPTAVFIVANASLRNVEINCTLAASYFMIAAAGRGLGTCWIHFARFITDPGLLQELGLPDGHVIVAPIIVGTPKSVPSMPHRHDPEIVFASAHTQEVEK